MPILYDEAHTITISLSERSALIEKLRAATDIPTKLYEVSGAKVFVGEALIEMLVDGRRSNPERDLLDLARELLPDAWVTPEEAVRRYRIAPVPYTRSNADGLAIVHRAFNAVLPGRYPGEMERDAAMARLLVGDVLPGDATFTVGQQPMTPIDPTDIGSIPDCPGMPAPAFRTLNSHPIDTLSWSAGLPWLSEEAFAAIQTLRSTWARQNQAIANMLTDSTSSIAALCAGIDPVKLVQTTDAAGLNGEFPPRSIEMLRQGLDEANAIPDRTIGRLLRHWLDLNGWKSDDDTIVYHAADFIRFLIAISVGCPLDITPPAANFVLYRMQTVSGVVSARGDAETWNARDKAISGLAWTMAQAVHHLARYGVGPVLIGPTLSTIQDHFRFHRRVGTSR